MSCETSCNYGIVDGKPADNFILSPESETPYSKEINVGVGECVVVRGYNLGNVRLMAEMVDGVGGNQVIGPLIVAGGRVQLASDVMSEMAFGKPGKYRFAAVDAISGEPAPVGAEMPTVVIQRHKSNGC